MPSAKRASRPEPGSYLDDAWIAFASAGVVVGAVVVGFVLPAPASAQSVDLEVATRAYAELRLEEAWSEIERAIASIAGAPQAVPREVRVRAYVLEASIARARADLTASDAALDRALAIEPALALDPALHPPPLLEALERRRAALAVTSTPPEPEPSDPGPEGPDDGLARSPQEEIVAPNGSVLAGPDVDGEDPWPWLGLGLGGAVVLGGVIALSVVLAQPPASFEVRGTIVP